MKVLALVDRDSGKARTMVVDKVDAVTQMPIVLDNVAREARIMTDEHSGYASSRTISRGSHGRGEYVNLEDCSIDRNTAEGYFSIFKRGMRGVYQWEQHLHRHSAEFEFRYLRVRKRDSLRTKPRSLEPLQLMGLHWVVTHWHRNHLIDCLVVINGGSMRLDPDKLRRITSREQEVLEPSAAGLSAKAVASQLDISPRTVERHLANLRQKLRARNRSQLVAMAEELGVLGNWPKVASGRAESRGKLNGERKRRN